MITRVVRGEIPLKMHLKVPKTSMRPSYLLNASFIISMFLSSTAYAEQPLQGGIYWAAPFDAVASGMARCKHFDTPSLEEQKDRLTKKYGNDLKDTVIRVNDGGIRVFTASRHNQETNEDSEYTYFESLNACEDFQSKALQGSASVSIANAVTITIPCSNGGGSGGWMFDSTNIPENMFPLKIVEVKELHQGSEEERSHPNYDDYTHPGDPDYDAQDSIPRYGYCTVSPATPKQVNTQQTSDASPVVADSKVAISTLQNRNYDEQHQENFINERSSNENLIQDSILSYCLDNATLFILSILASGLTASIIFHENRRRKKERVKKMVIEIDNLKKDTENTIIAILEQEGFAGLEGAINLWNIDRKDSAIAVYRRYLELGGSINFYHDGLKNLHEEDGCTLYDEAVQFVIEARKASISSIQRQFKLGYNHAAELIENMEAEGIVSTPESNGSRIVIAPAIQNITLLKYKLKQEVKGKSAFNLLALLEKELECRCMEIVLDHRNTLIKKHKQMVIIDDYGKKITDQWAKEKVYFLNNIALKDDDIVDILNKLKQSHKSFITSYSDVIFDKIESVIALNKDLIPNITDISNLSPTEFEQFCADVLNDNGWTARVNGKTGDQGVDVIAEKDGKIIAIQCKLYSSPIGNSSVQEVFSGMHHHHADYAAVVSNQPFTRSAKQLSATTGVILLHYSELNGFAV